MTKYSYVDLEIKLGDTSPPTDDISKYVTSINGWNVENVVEEVTGAGESTDRWAAIGFDQKSEVELTGPYDDDSDGLVHIIKNWGDKTETKNLKLAFSPTDSIEVEVLLHRAQRNPARGQFHEFVVTLRPTGAITT